MKIENVNIEVHYATKEIECLESMLGIPKENMLVVGSLALRAHGFPIDAVSDIDMEVKGITDEQLGKILLLKAAAQNTTFEVNYCSQENRYDFMFRGIKYNIWSVESFSHSFCWLDYIKYANPLSVLKVKLAYNRPKDVLFLKKLITSILE